MPRLVLVVGYLRGSLDCRETPARSCGLSEIAQLRIFLSAQPRLAATLTRRIHLKRNPSEAAAHQGVHRRKRESDRHGSPWLPWAHPTIDRKPIAQSSGHGRRYRTCLLYTSDAAD